MKHTDFAELRNRIRNQEIAELIAAVEAHGGKYVFDNIRLAPRVNTDPEYESSNMVDILDIVLLDRNCNRKDVIMHAHDIWWDSECLVTLDDLCDDDILEILDRIPETDEVFDVTIGQQ